MRRGPALTAIGAVFLLAILITNLVRGQAPNAISVRSLTTRQSEIRVGNTVPLILLLKDDELEVQSIGGTFTSPDGVEAFDVTFIRSRQKGKFTADVSIPPTSIGGSWELSGLTVTFDNGQTMSLEGNLSLRVVENDPTSGASGFAVSVPAGSGSQIGDSHDYTIPIRLFKGMGPGTWKLARIALTTADGSRYLLVSGRDFNGISGKKQFKDSFVQSGSPVTYYWEVAVHSSGLESAPVGPVLLQAQ